MSAGLGVSRRVSRRIHIEIQRNAYLICIFGGLGVGGVLRVRPGGGIHRTVDKDGFMYGNPRCRAIEMLITP